MSQAFYPKIIIVSGFLLQLPLHQGGGHLQKRKKSSNMAIRFKLSSPTRTFSLFRHVSSA